MRVHFTIPVRFSDEPHPLGCTPDDWFDVEVPEGIGDPDLVARDVAVAAVGKTGWMTTYFDGPDWDEVRSAYAPGSCQVVLRADPSEGRSS